MQVKLKVVQGNPKGKEFTLPARKFLIGRAKGCHLRPNSDMVSRHHCAVLVEDDAVRVRNLSTTNGTLVNGKRIDGETTVKSGDLLQVGPLVFAFDLVAPGDQSAPKKEAETQKPRDVAPAAKKRPARRAEQPEGDEDVLDWISGESGDADSAGDTQTIDLTQTEEIDNLGDEMAEAQPDPKKKAADSKAASQAAADILRKYLQGRE